MINSPHLTIGYIQQAVATAYGLDVRLLISPRRARKIARPRQVAMWLVFKLLPDYSLPAIGVGFGNRDHATIMHGVRRIDDLADRDPAFFATLVDLRDRIVEATTPPPTIQVPIRRQARELARTFTKAAYGLAEANPDLAARVFRDLAACLKPISSGEKQ